MPTLDWIGKQAVVNHHREVPTRLLHCDGSLSAGDPDAGNLLVQGDNLEALKALLPYYAGKVKCIYIDPPYNTGSEGWVYDDNISSPELKAWLNKVVGKESEDLCRHDKWLCMMYPRLRLLSDFLSPDGVMFVSCDGNELPRLLEIGREILSKRDAIVISVVNNLKGRNDKSHVAQAHEYLILFSTRSFVASGLPLSEAQRKRFKFIDSRGQKYELRDLRRRGGFVTREERPNLFFKIYRNTLDGKLSLEQPTTEHAVITPVKSDGEDGRWRWSEDRVRRYLPFLESTYVKKTGRWNLN
jgi:adenine-specific DNA-methyltransferase